MDLSDLFRQSLKSGDELITLAQELELTRRYVAIEQLRLGERLQIEWDIEEQTLKAPLLPLVVQPLVENAIYHGLERLPAGGVIIIQSREIDGGMSLVITNPLPAQDGPARHGNHLAVENIRNRLSGLTPSPGELDVRVDGDRFIATITVPMDQ